MKAEFLLCAEMDKSGKFAHARFNRIGMEDVGMQKRSNLLDLAICCALILLSLLGFISYFISGLLRGDIDGLLLLAICFLTGSIFSALLLLILRSAGWVKLFATKRMKNAVLTAGLEQLQIQPASVDIGSRSR
jgi:hypothetical protein